MSVSGPRNEPLVLHISPDAPDDVWAVIKPSIQKFIYQDGSPYGRGQAVTYTWGDHQADEIGLDLEIKIEVWRNSAGINVRRV